MEGIEMWLIKLMALLSLLTGGTDLSKMARQDFLARAKNKAKHVLELGKKVLP